MFLVYRWMPCEEEYNYMTVYDLVMTGSPRQTQFYPILTHYAVYGIWTIIRINPITISQYFNPVIGALTIIPIYLLSKQFFNKKQSLLVCLFWTFSEASFYRTSYFGSTETLGFFLAISGLYLYRRKKYLFSSLFIFSSLMSHLLPAFFVVAVIFLHQIFTGTKKQKLISLFTVLGVILFINSPFSPHQRLLSVINPSVIFSQIDKTNIGLYSLTDIGLGISIFSGIFILGIFTFWTLITKGIQNKFIFSMLLTAIGLFVFSWISYSPFIFAPPRLTFYFVLPFSYYFIKLFANKRDRIVKTLIIFLICVSMVMSSVKGLETVLWIDDSLTASEYKVLDELQKTGQIINVVDWWGDYGVKVALSVRQPYTITWEVKVEQTINIPSVSLTQNMSEEDFGQTIIEDDMNKTMATKTKYKYIFLSERMERNGFFVVWGGVGGKRSLLVHKPVADVWKNSTMWELKYDKYGVKIYEKIS